VKVVVVAGGNNEQVKLYARGSALQSECSCGVGGGGGGGLRLTTEPHKDRRWNKVEMSEMKLEQKQMPKSSV
jgi:hypothetical protein